jgi:hypothetical protein
MNPEVVEILQGVFFWVMIAGVIGGYIFLRIANRNRDRAAFIEFPDSPDKFLLRARIAYAVFIVFLLAMIGGLGIVVFQTLQIYRPSFPIAVLSPSATPVLPVGTPEPTATATTRTRTATPVPTGTQPPPESPTPVFGYQARVGNTNFEGVNVRAGPGLENDIVTKLSPGTLIDVFDEPAQAADGYDWAHVRIDEDTEGWIAANFLIPITTPGP